MNEQRFEETYAQMVDGELARALRGRRTLIPEARAALDKEVAKRGLDPEKLRKQRPSYGDEHKHPTTLEKRMKHKRLRWSTMLGLMVLSFFFALALDHFEVLQLYWPAWITILIPAFTIWGFWELRGRFWFWAVILLVMATQIAIFSLVGWPWGTHWVPGRAIAGMCTVELIPISAGLAWLEKRSNKHYGAGAQAPLEEP
jgi:hypothetical protein